MRTYAYDYRVESSFSPAVELHFWKLRAVPCDNACQHLLGHQLSITPSTPILHSVDGMGNQVQWGDICHRHDHFCMQSRGWVACDLYALPDPHPSDLFLCPSALTQWDGELRRWASGRDATQLMTAVHERLEYRQGTTGNQTTALEVFAQRSGVCQDYAHLLVAACRASGIYARYVNGLMVGEGETHAWVEAYENGRWIGLDPTAGRRIDYGYLKIAHGRDVGDCPSNRGRISPFTWETLHVSVRVEAL